MYFKGAQISEGRKAIAEALAWRDAAVADGWSVEPMYPSTESVDRAAKLRHPDARLIAAAPDLARSALIDEALQCIGYTEAACRWLRERGIEPPPREKLAQWQRDERRAALAKARGETP